MADQILKKLEEHNEQFEKLGQKIDSVARKVGEHDKKFDRIIKSVVDNKERLDKMDHKMENFVTKDDHQEVMNTLDKIVGLSEKKDQELVFMGENVKRHTADIEKIKPLVGLEMS